MIVIITNNPKTAGFVTQHYPAESSIIRLIFCSVRDEVYTQVRDYIHRHWHLINHAMYGNIQLHKQPYRSMILAKGNSLDTKSLQLWERAAECVKRGYLPAYPIHILEDFQELDFSLFSTLFRTDLL